MHENKERFQIRNLSRMGEASPVPPQPTAKGVGGLGARKSLGAASVMEGGRSRTPGCAGMWKAGVSGGVWVVLSRGGSGPGDPAPWDPADTEFLFLLWDSGAVFTLWQEHCSSRPRVVVAPQVAITEGEDGWVCLYRGVPASWGKQQRPGNPPPTQLLLSSSPCSPSRASVCFS